MLYVHLFWLTSQPTFSYFSFNRDFFPFCFVSLTTLPPSIHAFHVAPWDPQISDLTHALQGNPEMTRLLSSTYNSDILNLVSLLLFVLQTYIFGGLTFICIWMSYRSSCSLECNWIMPPSPKQLLLLWQVFPNIFITNHVSLVQKPLICHQHHPLAHSSKLWSSECSTPKRPQICLFLYLYLLAPCCLSHIHVVNLYWNRCLIYSSEGIFCLKISEIL